MPSDILDIKAVLFDVDGTLIDSLHSGRRKMHTAGKQHGHPFGDDQAELLGRIWGKPVPELFEHCFPDATDRERAGMMEIFYSINDTHELPLIPGARETLDHLREREMVLTILTSREYDTTVRVLELHGIHEHFVHVAARDTVEAHKPLPGVLACTRRKLQSFGIEDKHCIVVGDTYDDFHTAVNNGLGGAVMVKTGPLGQGDHPTIPTRDFIPSIADLPRWFDTRVRRAA